MSRRFVSGGLRYPESKPPSSRLVDGLARQPRLPTAAAALAWAAVLSLGGGADDDPHDAPFGQD